MRVHTINESTGPGGLAVKTTSDLQRPFIPINAHLITCVIARGRCYRVELAGQQHGWSGVTLKVGTEK